MQIQEAQRAILRDGITQKSPQGSIQISAMITAYNRFIGKRNAILGRIGFDVEQTTIKRALANNATKMLDLQGPLNAVEYDENSAANHLAR